MFQNFYGAKPFTTYWYYPDALSKTCGKCQTEQMHYLLRYRIYLFAIMPIIPTGTNYYLVCSNCANHYYIDSEDELMSIQSSVKDTKPLKYSKNSQLDLEGYIEDEPMVFGTEKELRKNIQMHIKDMHR
ncbi:MAG: hypothetical protein MJA31_10150 [Clostridia bacterium]|nr:hypothetical protein [Clostridia bacterium]